MTKRPFIPVGKSITFHGVQAKAIATQNKHTCKGCCFVEGRSCPLLEDMTECHWLAREDHRNIQFVEV